MSNRARMNIIKDLIPINALLSIRVLRTGHTRSGTGIRWVTVYLIGQDKATDITAIVAEVMPGAHLDSENLLKTQLGPYNLAMEFGDHLYAADHGFTCTVEK